jgi:hypothetical protein
MDGGEEEEVSIGNMVRVEEEEPPWCLTDEGKF